jgi:hypothetical protein
LELRWSGDYLKERNIRRPEEFLDALPSLICEALYTRRLTKPTNDKNRRRWPLHPLWSEAMRLKGEPTMQPLGRIVTGRRGALLEAAQRSLAGHFRSLSILASGGYDERTIIHLVRSAIGRIQKDQAHDTKIEKAQMRYRGVSDAR